MEKKEIDVIVVGIDHDAGLLALKIAELKAANPNIEVVTIEEAKKRGIVESFPITAPKELPVIPYLHPNNNFYFDGKSARNKRREAERKAKKKFKK